MEEIDALLPEERNSVALAKPFGSMTGPCGCGLLCERIHPETAEVIATFMDDFYAGEPAITVNQVGKGRAYYVGTALDDQGLSDFVASVAQRAGIEPTLPGAPAGVEAVRRVSPSGEALLYVLNHNRNAVSVPLPAGRHQELLTGEPVQKQIELAAYGVAILAPEGH